MDEYTEAMADAMDRCTFCLREGHRASNCPARRKLPGLQADDAPPQLAWHTRQNGWLAADDTGKILGEVRQVEPRERYLAIADNRGLGEYIDLQSAQIAVNQALGFSL